MAPSLFAPKGPFPPPRAPLFSGPKLFNNNASSNNHSRASLNNDGPSDFKLSDFKLSDSSSSSDDTVIASYNDSRPTVDKNSHAGASVPEHQSTGPSGAAVEGLRERVRVLEGRTDRLECKTEQLQTKHRVSRDGKGLAELVAGFFQWIAAVYLWWIGVIASQRAKVRGARRRRRRQGQET